MMRRFFVLMLSAVLLSLTSMVMAQEAEPPKNPGLFKFIFGSPKPTADPAPAKKPAPAAQGATREPVLKRGLFGRPLRQQQEPAAQPAAKKPAPARKATVKKKRRVVKRKATSARATPDPAPSQSDAIGTEIVGPAQNVLVIGDFMAQALAKGLPQAFQDNPAVRIVNAANGSSGLVRTDYFDWPGAVTGLVETYDPDAIIVVIGGNDRQNLTAGRNQAAFGSEEWNQEYASRVAAFATVLAATGRPVLWAGLVPVRKTALSTAYSAINTIIQEQVQGDGIAYVDTWNGFADDQGRFAVSGPDINGQIVKLRAGDGLNFTRPGQRKLAYFVEDSLKRVLMEGAVPLFSTESGEGADALRIGPMVSLEITASGEGRLSSFGGYDRPDEGSQVSEPTIAPIGRVDNFVWPRPETVPADDFPAEVSAAESLNP